tara:strand:+ start:505 stop:1155 length:651 start_codon:yes stop_codon:yes gene_type:complete
MCLVLSGNVYAKRYGSKICESPEYTCYTTKKGDTWAKLFPDETERDIIKRINRMNVPLPRGTKIAIPVMVGTDYMEHAPFPEQDDATGNKYIVISLSKLAFGAYGEDGVLQYWGPISPGKNYCSDIRRGCRTPTGTFAIYSKRGAGCKSSKYPVGKGGAPMPYCMFFHRGYAMHGAKQVPGYPASHGCIRMDTVDAKWLSNTFTAGVSKVPVIISK